jgi:tRNA (mo5U34)-methyltransferase
MSRENKIFGQLLSCWDHCPWLVELGAIAERRLRDHPHGELPRWQAALKELPATEVRAVLDQSAPELGSMAADPAALSNTLMAFHPWRKGPLSLGGVRIETEWRSDWKWQRIAPHIDLAGNRVLDIGCGNGYFGLRMLGAGARLVVGIDPTLLFVMQWLAGRHFSGNIPNFVLPLGIEQLPEIPVELDTVFSMGVLYHRRQPLPHLERIRALLGTNGTMVLETLVLPADRKAELLVPDGRYARMRNVWGIPGTQRLLDWVEKAGFSEAKVVDVTPTTTREQRTTSWMTFESLEQALDADDPSRTVEGAPAPVRAVIVARR